MAIIDTVADIKNMVFIILSIDLDFIFSPTFLFFYLCELSIHISKTKARIYGLKGILFYFTPAGDFTHVDGF